MLLLLLLAAVCFQDVEEANAQAVNSERIRFAADTAHSSIQFRTRHWGIHDIIGWFEDYEVIVYADYADFTNAVVEARVRPASVRMPNPAMAGNLRAFRAAVLKDVDRAIITPGVAEKPLWSSSETGKIIFQFKSFAASAHAKILVADLQYRDAAALNGFLMAVALGGVSYGAKQLVAGRELSSDPEKLIVESLDRSGAFGYFWDVNNILEKVTRGTVGVNAAIGQAPMSRYATRNITGALLGPSLGTVQDLSQVIGAVSTGDLSKSDIRAMRKMLPYQNLFYMRQLLNQLEEKAAEKVGAGQ